MNSLSSLLILVFPFGCNDGDRDEIPDGQEPPADRDGDGFDADEDCNDQDAAVNPWAEEVCDGIDNDCDDAVDDADDGLVGDTFYYADEDGDGYGDDTSGAVHCEPPVELVDVAGDCDDTDAEVNPAALEICNDGIDNNCDNAHVGCEATAESTGAALLGEGEGDEAGSSIAVADIDGDGSNDSLVGARGHDDIQTDAGAAYLMYGPLDLGQRSLATADAKLVGEAFESRAGRTVGIVGDLDGDAFPELVVSAPAHTGAGTQSGVIYLVSPDAVGTGTIGLADVAWQRLEGYYQFQYAGAAIAPAGDVDGDLSQDVWIGASGDDTGGHNAGSVFLFQGPLAGGSRSLADAEAELTGEAEARLVGSVLATGDFDGDGLGDLLVGDANDDDNGAGTGAAYFVSGAAAGTASLADADAKVIGDATGDAFGTSVAATGDADGDGRTDLLVGAPEADPDGVASGKVVLLPGSGLVGSVVAMDVATATWTGDESDLHAGSTVAGGGDFDGDDVSDFVIGAEGYGIELHGAAYLVLGPASGVTPLTLGERVVARVVGTTTGERVGHFVSFSGPVADGYDQGILVSAPYADQNGTDAGAVFVALRLGP